MRNISGTSELFRSTFRYYSMGAKNEAGSENLADQ